MANTFAPFGFRQYSGTGSAPTYEQTVAYVAYNNTTAIYFGDPVVQLNTGYIAQATAGTTQIAGIFVGCKYLSVSQKRTVWSNYWPGTSDVASGNSIEAYVINDPNAQFLVQSGNGGPVTFASIGNNLNFAMGTGNSANGISGAHY